VILIVFGFLLYARALDTPFFWKVDLADNQAHPATSLSTWEGRLGAVAISRCASIIKG
jgi:hypothetical protein